MSKIQLPNTQLLIDGNWTDAASGERFTTLDPATEAPLADVALAGAQDADVAVKAAHRALERGKWAEMSGAERGRILYRLAAIFRERMDEIVLLESIDAGKPLAATRRQDVAAAIDTLAKQLVTHFGAPAIEAAVAAAEEEFEFAASLCNHPLDTLIAMHRSHDGGEIREAFRTLRPKDGPKPLRAFAFLDVAGEDEPADEVDLAAMAKDKQRDK